MTRKVRHKHKKIKKAATKVHKRRQRQIIRDYTITSIVATDGTTSIVPVIKNECEAELLHSHFGALLTAGPPAEEVQWNHPNHRVVPFADFHDYGPTTHVMNTIMDFGVANPDVPMLVHCHAGMSRSPAAALAILCARGVDAEHALTVLRDAHPPTREFTPNRLAVSITAELLDLPHLPDLARAYEVWPNPVAWDHREPFTKGSFLPLNPDDRFNEDFYNRSWDDPFDDDLDALDNNWKDVDDDYSI